MKNSDLDNGSSQEARILRIQKCIQSLVYALQCRDDNCRLPRCQKMKRVILHMKYCKKKINCDCSICKQLIELCCYHAKHCQETEQNKCLVPFCSYIKHKIRQLQLQRRLRRLQRLLRYYVKRNNCNCSGSRTNL